MTSTWEPMAPSTVVVTDGAPAGRSPILAAMADRKPDDEGEAPVDEVAADDSEVTGAAEPDASDGEEAKAGTGRRRATTTRTKPVDAKADVAARRAATKARMDAAASETKRRPAPTERSGSSPVPERRGKGRTGKLGSDGEAKTGGATASDPTGSRARKATRVGHDKVEVGKASAADPTGAKARRQAAESAKAIPKPSKRTGRVDPKAVRTAARSGDPKKAAAESSRYTAPIPRSQLESSVWVPGIMFVLLGAGMVVIFLTYVVWGGRPLTLGVGLALILGGILTATQYR